MQLKTKNNTLKFILYGLLLYEIGINFGVYNINISLGLVVVGIIIIIYNFLVQRLFEPFNGFFGFVFYLFIIWSLFIIFRPDGFSISLMRQNIVNKYNWIGFVAPLIVFMGIKQLSLNTLYRFIYLYGIVGIILFAINFQHYIVKPSINMNYDAYRDYIKNVNKIFEALFTASFIIVSFRFVSNKYNKIAFLSMALGLFLSTITARRSQIFMYLLMFIFSFYSYIFYSNNKSKFIRLLFVLFIISSIAFLFYIYLSSFSLILSRLEDNSRAPVEEYFFNSFRGHTTDWIFGRGINGTYYSPIFADININPNRDIIETGYLYLILKGGVLYLFLFLYILLYSAYLGFFKSRNSISKGMAFYIFAHVIYLLPFGLPSFSLEYIIVWICVLYTQSKSWRMSSDESIMKYLALNYKNRKIL
jgi:hypothetical protein